HKFDPISQREFYQLFAFFNNLDGAPLDGNKKDPAPVLKVETAEQTAELEQLAAEQARVEARFADELAAFAYEEPATAAAPSQAAAPARREIVWIDDALPAGAAPDAPTFDWAEAPSPVQRGRRAIRRQVNGVDQQFFRRADQKLRIANGDVLVLWVYVDPDAPPDELLVQWNSDGGDGWHHGAYWGKGAIDYGKAGTTQRTRIGDVPRAGEWVRLEVPVARVGLRAGMAVHGIALTQSAGTSYWDAIGIETSCEQCAEDYVWIDDETPAGSKLEGNGPIWQWQPLQDDVEPEPHRGSRLLRRTGKGLNQDFFTGATVPLRVQDGDVLFAHAWLDPKDPPRSIQLQFHSSGSWNHRARWGAPAHGAGQQGGGDFVAGVLPETGGWVRLEVAIADVGLRPGDPIDGQAFTKVDGTVCWDHAGVRTHGPPDETHRHSLLAWEPIGRDSADVPAEVRAAIAVPTAQRDPGQQQTIRAWWLRHVWAGAGTEFAPLRAKLDEIAQRRIAIEQATPTTLVMKERKEPRDAFVLLRGQYDQKGEKVDRATPAALPAMDPAWPRDRLGLARWLVDPGQPLTARVTVNRFWQQLFGSGLVRTSEDFGNQGERPSHPQLLDYLATRFQKTDWNVKQLMRFLVLSSTYRQASTVTADMLAVDPDNRWLARGPRFRLDAETLRDQALALAGLLVRTVGGPAVKPPQPAGLWRAVGYSSSNTARFEADVEPDKIHRRSLYTFWKRTAPPPQMTTFDAPSREECRVRRERTNTPLQALLLLNDPQYVEAARGFATRILERPGDDAARIGWALECATCQQPVAADVDEVRALLTQQRAAFAADVAAALQLTGAGDGAGESRPSDAATVELAAWTVIANLILNLDAVLTKG
ncbi:MAG: DUF1553 domain-containing protein, partial [Planctomycetes bacterium]|nr:DUF1553 domain-containing protein [Planctomycetota bacterium]